MDDTWTIGELAELASGALAGGGPRQVSGRVREVPNDRLIRWYATVGLVDPPLRRTGRVARYGRLHLLQLVAVKRRQAEGRSLAEIQAELVGATDGYLESVARIAAAVPGSTAASGPVAAVAGAAGVAGAGEPDRRFWRQRAAAARGADQEPEAGAVPAVSAVHAAPAGRAIEPEAGVPEAGLVGGIRLAPGVLLLLDSGAAGVRAADAAELRSAAGPLIKALARQGYLIGTGEEERNRS